MVEIINERYRIFMKDYKKFIADRKLGISYPVNQDELNDKMELVSLIKLFEGFVEMKP